MKKLAMVLAVFALTAVACVTSEPIDLDAGSVGSIPITTTGAAGQTGGGQAGTSGNTSGDGGASAGDAGTSGAAGTPGTSGAAGGTVPASGTGSAGQGGSVASSTGQGGASAVDGGADVKPTTDATAATDGGVSVAAPTWTDIYNKLLVNMSYASNCTGSACHDPGTQKGLDLSTQAKGYTTIKSHLVVGNPTSSQLVQKISSGSMPAGRPKMPTADLNVIKTWIMAGASNN